MYDTTRPKTFDHIGNWLEEIEINRPATRTKANLVIAIVGTKADAEGSERRAGDSIQIDVGGFVPAFLSFLKLLSRELPIHTSLSAQKSVMG